MSRLKSTREAASAPHASPRSSPRIGNSRFMSLRERRILLRDTSKIQRRIPNAHLRMRQPDLRSGLYLSFSNGHLGTVMSELPPPRPKRRPRYRGTHPRHFHEKYKEHQPERYAEEIGKILASGKTPAGMHRPIMVREILEVLAPKSGETAVDATLGYGGHTTELLRAILPNGRLLALDVDPIELPKTEARLRSEGFAAESLIVRRSNFAGLAQALAAEDIAGADLILADLGLSSMQMDDPTRGFTFKRPGPLDLRMNTERGQPASAMLASLDVSKLSLVLEEHSDEPHARYLADKIITARTATPITTTSGLSQIIREAMESRPGSRSLFEVDTTIRRVFQALRVLVNDEFSALETFLRRLPDCLKSGGRAAVLTFHSGEDRRVKKAFQQGAATGAYVRIAEEVIRPGPEEIRANPRSSSAKLRWAVRG
jgi:16S rRNA (cytosine1402-N4)-methyltransferase